MATQKQLQSVIKKQLRSFNTGGYDIDDETLISLVLSSSRTGVKRASDLFKGFILWTLDENKHKRTDGKKNTMPSGWSNMTVSGLAEKLMLLIIVCLLSFTSVGQLQVNIGAVKTDLRKNAMNFAFQYLKNLDSTYGNRDYFYSGRKSFLLFTPEAEFKTGNEDAFSSIALKLTGNFAKFRTTMEDGLVTPDADKTVHVFPISVGAETNNQFEFLNGLLEFGYEPYYHSPLARSADWVKHTRFGIYVQAGYKFNLQGKDSVLVGGARDESAEDVNEGILRMKGDLQIDTDAIIKISGVRIGLIGRGTTWLDALNKEIYYRLDGKVRFYLTSITFFDLLYNKGSGAPNFNTGDQFGAGLTVNF